MAEHYLDIGGIALKVSGKATAERLLSLPGMSTFVCPPCEPALQVLTDIPVAYDNFNATYSNVGEMLSFQFGTATVALRPALLLRFESGAVMTMYLECEGQIVMTAMSDEELRFALWKAMALFGLVHSVLPIHTSTILYHDKAVLFLGESGTGKSTHTRLWLNTIPGCRLLNDDSPFLNASSLEVYGSPWSGKTHCYLKEKAPIAALVRLRQALENKICRLSTLEAFAALQPSLPPAFFTVDQCRDRALRFVADVVGRVPVYRLDCLPDAEAALLACQTLFANQHRI
ncbi:MAG: hypothetical protein K5864_06215 [Bacteroidales bacterium]|nr:hypothetical protein [Bacteroidales bacterium]